MRSRMARRRYFKKNAYLRLTDVKNFFPLAAMTALAQCTAVGIRCLTRAAFALLSFDFFSDRWHTVARTALDLLADSVIFFLLAPIMLGIFRAAESANRGESITCGDIMIYFSSVSLLKFAYSYAAVWRVILLVATKLPKMMNACANILSLRFSVNNLWIRPMCFALTVMLWLLMAFALSRMLMAPTVLRKNPAMSFFTTLRCAGRASRKWSGEQLALLLSFVFHLLPMIFTCGISLILTIPVLALAEAGMNEWIYSLCAEAVESGAYFKKTTYRTPPSMKRRFAVVRQGKE